MTADPFPTQHRARVLWEGTRDDLRAHRLEIGEQSIGGSTMRELGGDPRRADPEAMFVGSLSACHMLWFLDLSRRRRLRVVSYADDAVGTMDGDRMTRVELRPAIAFEEDPGSAVVAELHRDAHERCFLANSVVCPVEVVT
jgi:organic hydroperoxide reductase OsmC/OhrA